MPGFNVITKGKSYNHGTTFKAIVGKKSVDKRKSKKEKIAQL
jgi:hypothetical protein